MVSQIPNWELGHWKILSVLMQIMRVRCWSHIFILHKILLGHTLQYMKCKECTLCKFLERSVFDGFTFMHILLSLYGNYPRTCTRGKVISLSVCHHRCPQKTGIFWDLQVQMRHKTVKIGEKMMYLCLCLLLTIHECDKSWFLYARPIRHTYGGYSIMHYDCACPSTV